MNEIILKFFEELKAKPDVVGIILFGSWARGNNRRDSDVDLVVILENGYKRAVEKKEGQVFEIIYTTEKSGFNYWSENKDDAYGLWSVAKIIYDKDGRIEKLKTKTLEMLSVGKKAIGQSGIEQLHFDSIDQVEYAEKIYLTDKTIANMILHNKVFTLTETYFDIKRLWTPAPKQRLIEISKLDSKLSDLLIDFYLEEKTFSEKVEVAKEIIKRIYEK